MAYCATTQFCPHLNLNGVGNSLLVSKAINSRVLATNAVTTAKILNFKITTAKLATSGVTNAKIANATINIGGATSGAALGKLNAKYKSVLTKASNTAVFVTHGLGRTPVGYLVFAPDKAGTFYRGSTSYLRATHVVVKVQLQSVAANMMIW
jgi:hypothetical protein